MSSLTVEAGQPERYPCEFTIAILSAFNPDDAIAFAKSVTDINGKPRSWGSEEYDYSPVKKGEVYTLNSHAETLSPRYDSESTRQLFNATQSHREWSIVGNEIRIIYTPEGGRGAVKVSIHGRGGAGLPQPMTATSQYSVVFSATKGTQEVRVRLGRSMPDRFLSTFGLDLPYDTRHDPQYDGAVVCFNSSNTVNASSVPYYPDVRPGVVVGTVRVQWVVEVYEPMENRFTQLGRAWALLGCPMPGDTPCSGDLPGVYAHTKESRAIADAAVTDKSKWPPSCTEYSPPVKLKGGRQVRDVYGACFVGQRLIRDAAKKVEDMISMGAIDRVGYDPIMGFVEVENPIGEVDGCDLAAKTALSAYLVRNVDGSTPVGGRETPGVGFVGAPTLWPLNNEGMSMSPIPGGSSSIALDYIDAQSSLNDGQGHYCDHVAGGVYVGESKVFCGGIILRSGNGVGKKCPSGSIPKLVLGLQTTLARTIVLDGVGTEPVIVSGYSLNEGNVGEVGVEIATTDGSLTTVTCPPEKQYRALPIDIQRKITAATTPRFYVTAATMLPQSNGLFSDVLGFVGSCLRGKAGPSEGVPYFQGLNGTGGPFPGTHAGYIRRPHGLARNQVIKGVNSTNCTSFPMFSTSYFTALSPEDVAPGERFLSISAHVSMIVSDALVSNDTLITDTNHWTMGQVQALITRGNPAEDPQKAYALAVQLASAQDNTTERIEEPGLLRFAPGMKPGLNFTTTFTDHDAKQRVFEVPGAVISSSVRRLAASLSATMPTPDKLPAEVTQVSDPSLWPLLSDGDEFFIILAYAAQSGVSVHTSSQQVYEYVYLPGPPQVIAKHDTSGYLTDVAMTGKPTSWGYVESFDLDVSLGTRSKE
jgi:hypothetical protein